MGGCVDKLPVGGDEVDDVAHDAEQRHHEHGIHAGDDLRAEQGHDHPHARDAGEQRPASRIALPSEGEQNGVAELHQVPTASTPTITKIQMREPAAEPFFPKM